MQSKTQSQRKKILKLLERGGKLTALKALRWYKCLRLSGRIKELRKEGHDIKTELVKTRTGKWVAEYSL